MIAGVSPACGRRDPTDGRPRAAGIPQLVVVLACFSAGWSRRVWRWADRRCV